MEKSRTEYSTMNTVVAMISRIDGVCDTCGIYTHTQ